ncbi:MAG: DUF4175 family protein, partial [Candidatus Tectomicrobia bacterium]|nr:DUF4175 family protein [Candidatus Tectomicrobia bacterium]
LNALQNARMQAQNSMMGGLMGEMANSNNELQKLAEEQREILKNTEKIDKESAAKLMEFQKGKMEEMREKGTEQILSLLEQNRQIWRERSKDAANLDRTGREYRKTEGTLREMMAALSKGDFQEIMKALEGAQADFQALSSPQNPKAQEGIDSALKKLSELSGKLRELTKGQKDILSREEKKEVGSLAQREQNLKEKTEDLEARLKELSNLFPFLSPELMKNLGEAIPFMGDASDDLSKMSPKEALPPEREALYRLSKAQESLQQSMQQMAQRSQMGGMPMPMVVQRGIGGFNPGMQPDVSQLENGRLGLNTKDFEIPTKKDYKVPKIYREELLEALKSGYPQQYRELVEKYFKSLSE